MKLGSRFLARAGGACWLMTILTGILALFARGSASTAVVLVSTAFYAAATFFVYLLLKPVSNAVSLLAAFFSVVGCVQSTLVTFDRSPVDIEPLVFFGLHCLLVGTLIVRSTFLPRVLGVLMMLAGLGWLTALSPALANSVSPFNILPGILGETTLSVWLLVKGVSASKWDEGADASQGRGA